MRYCIVLLAMLFTSNLLAQQKPTELDKSPMDMSYWPANYPILKMSGKAKDLPVARVIYGRPLKNGRDIFGGIIKYNELWRMGANEASEIEFFKNVRIDGKLVPKGRYTLYCIPQENKWTLILNKDNFCWGNFSYDAKKDQIRSEVEVGRQNESVEAFTIYFEDTRNGAQMVILWDELKAALPMVAVEDASATTKPKTKGK